MQENHAKWVKLVSRIAAGAQIFVTARMRDKPRVVNDCRERLAKKEFSTLEAYLIDDILQKYPDPEYVTFFSVFFHFIFWQLQKRNKKFGKEVVLYTQKAIKVDNIIQLLSTL